MTHRFSFVLLAFLASPALSQEASPSTIPATGQTTLAPPAAPSAQNPAPAASGSEPAATKAAPEVPAPAPRTPETDAAKLPATPPATRPSTAPVAAPAPVPQDTGTRITDTPAIETPATAKPAPSPAAVAEPTPPTQAATETPSGLNFNGLPGSILSHYAQMKDTLLTALEEGSDDHMSPVGMFMAADWVVKAVMLSLAFASVITWAVFAAKLVQLWTRKRGLKRQYRVLDRAGSLDRITGRLSKGRGLVGRMVQAARLEIDRSATTGSRHTGLQAETKAGIKERTASVLSRIELGAARKMGSGTGILANIGSTAPFVGLFGTVWGIMNSFISIAESNTTNLAVVAPGIAEALLATAIGLVAAIPAVIFYNLLARGIGGYKIMLGDAAALVERTLSRDLDLPHGPDGVTRPAAPRDGPDARPAAAPGTGQAQTPAKTHPPAGDDSAMPITQQAAE